MEGKHIKFFEFPAKKGRKTKIWRVESKHNGVSLGFVSWFPAWRKYAFFPNSSTIYEEECLRDISKFVEEQTSLRKESRE